MGDSPESEYAVSVAESYNWYRAAAIIARRMYRGSEVSVMVISALVPPPGLPSAAARWSCG
jgi:hypothetical protein